MNKTRFQALDEHDLDAVAGGCGGYGGYGGYGDSMGYALPDSRQSSYASPSRMMQGPSFDFAAGVLYGMLSHLDVDSPAKEAPARTPAEPTPTPGTPSGGGGIGV